jgi:hypothetical protein
MGYYLGMLVGALVGVFLVSRLLMWMTRGMGDTPVRILVAHGICYVVIIVMATFGYADGGPLNPVWPLVVYTPVQAIFLVVDFFARKGRLVKAHEAQANSFE